MSDELIEMQRLAHQELCEKLDDNCEYCSDTKVEEITEPWADRPEYDDQGNPNE